VLFKEELDRILEPGYMPIETGYYRLPNGQMYIAALIALPGCKGELVNWWYNSGLKDAETYIKWNPQSHIHYQWDEKWKPGHYVGASHFAKMRLGNEVFSFKLKCDDPAKCLDISKFEAAHVKAAFYGNGFTMEGQPHGQTVTVVRDTNRGCEIRSRYWINKGTEEMAKALLEQSMDDGARLSELLKSLKNEAEQSDNYGDTRCKFCQSNAVVRNGRRKNAQYYLCKDCGRGFVDNQALPKMKFPTCTIASAVRDYYNGCTLNQIRREMDLKTNALPSTSTIHRWVTRLTENALEEETSCHPVVGDKWIMYQTESRFKDRKYWLISIVDLQTHFLLAVKLFFKFSKFDISSLLNAAIEKAGKTPGELITNIGVENPAEIKPVYNSDAKQIHINTFASQEFYPEFVKSWHRIVQDRLKPGYDSDMVRSSQIITKGFAFHYNYINPLDGSNSIPGLVAKVKSSIGDWNSVFRSRSVYND
jgi:transposase-like protein